MERKTMLERVKEKLVELLTDKVPGIDNELRYVDDERVERLADYLIAYGVTVTPVKIGDTVYTNLAMQGWYLRKKDRPYDAKVVFIGLNGSEEMGGGLFNVVCDNGEHMWQFSFSDIGNTVFLNKEEAEAILSESQEE